MTAIIHGDLAEFQRALDILSLTQRGTISQYRAVQRTALGLLHQIKTGCTFDENDLQQVLVTFLDMKDRGSFDCDREKGSVAVHITEKAIQDTLRALKILSGKEIQILHIQDGIKYIGEVQNEQPHGKGKYVLRDGTVYWGDVQYGRLQGKGRLKYPHGRIYEGYFQDGRRHGHGKIIGPYGFEGEFHKDHFLSDLTYMKNLLFLHLLTGESDEIALPEYTLGITVSYLKEKGNTKLSEELESAYAILLGKVPNPVTFIMNKLDRNEPQLIVLQADDHTLGMKIVPIPSTNRIELRIYNSGAGLEEYHPFDLASGKFYTQLNVNIPKNQMTEKRLFTLLKGVDSVEELYEMILSIPQREIYPGSVEQQMQKAENCTLEWIFAFMKNEMYDQSMDDMEYITIRTDLIHYCINKIDENTKNFSEQDFPMFLHLRNRLEQMKSKREEKLKALLCPSLSTKSHSSLEI